MQLNQNHLHKVGNEWKEVCRSTYWHECTYYVLAVCCFTFFFILLAFVVFEERTFRMSYILYNCIKTIITKYAGEVILCGQLKMP